ncbi:MAG TPA: Gfo/Idh/MocA family oxidoreductase [Amycolatopsis sp.]|uniref:Gfo/Idh/MocA family oxidoreductase n=1 Tax=Amycolatopsis sp. TaxID=37632 RepID=UPI002B49709D|nr:Gfo/Idh/MocA family oxidoreductase [Amycolatopsis sp.]HKS49127.1 Gfo/Idh/MocA family oxidoreductase [Amycolatopsis sp.]
MRRYAVVGLGSRAQLFVRALAKSERAELVAFCDRNRTRMDVHNRWLREGTGASPVPGYPPGDFAGMLAKERVDVVVVCTPDHTHADYIVDALEAGCDVVTEKPMTTDVEGARRILRARRRTSRAVTVTFNYRYNPVHRRVRELLAEGAVGEIGSVQFAWLLDTWHGADYFRRWHREKARSGGLLVHKSGHHFDLVNWWLGSGPETVFAMGRLFFYGDQNGRRHGQRTGYARGTGDGESDPFALDLESSPRLRALYRDAEAEDGYLRDQNVFSPGITIEDDMAVLARYRGAVTLNYHLHAYSPREGYRVAFTGSKGRIELDVRENEYPFRTGKSIADLPPGVVPEPGRAKLTLQRHWAPAEVVLDTPLGEGHGGGDERMLAELLGQRPPDPLGSAADHEAGLQALLTGLAANRSMATGRPVRVGELLAEIGEQP